jgi:predicted SAM-dependent methyltransferase
MIKPKIIRKIEAKITWVLQKPSRLRSNLIKQNKTRWLDIGSSLFEEYFYCLNIHSPSLLINDLQQKYFQLDILSLTKADKEVLGKFDLIRMQHVFEHFSLEEGRAVLQTCSDLLTEDGFLVITVPDLKIHIQSYFDGYKWMKPYVEFARNRIPEDSPPSFIFSMYAHQGGYSPILNPGDSHKWCYDFEGLKYQLDSTNLFKNIREIGLLHPDANIPFTHNRPHEDLCLLAQKR